MKRRIIGAIAGGLAAFIVATAIAASANAEGGVSNYTNRGDVLVTVATDEDHCATATWPRGGTTTECTLYQTYQHNIEDGDTFGVKVQSYSGGSVACRVTDVETGVLLVSDVAHYGGKADCILHAV